MDEDELKNLNPEERIKRLKAIAKKNQDEIRKAEDLIKKSQDEIIEESESRKKSFPEPDIQPIDVNKLFQGSQLEEAVQKERELAQQGAELAQTEYQLNFAKELAEGNAGNIYGMAKQLYDKFGATGYLNEDEKGKFDAIMMETRERLGAMESGDYLASKSASQALVISYKMGKALQDMYKA